MSWLMPVETHSVGGSLRNWRHGTSTDTPDGKCSLKDLWSAQREHRLWKKVIYALESGDETLISELPMPLTHFLLSPDGVLWRYWKHKPVQIEQIFISDKFIPLVLRLGHNTPITAHPGHDKTLFAARKKCYWSTLRKDVEAYVARCVVCTQYKATTKGMATIVQYPLSDAALDVVFTDLLVLPTARTGRNTCWSVSIKFQGMLCSHLSKTKQPRGSRMPSSANYFAPSLHLVLSSVIKEQNFGSSGNMRTVPDHLDFRSRPSPRIEWISWKGQQKVVRYYSALSK